MKRHKRPLNRSITVGCLLFIIALCVLLSFANLTMYKNYVYVDYRNYIDDILNYTLSEINGDDLKTCVETGEESEQYKKTLLFMDHMMDQLANRDALTGIRNKNAYDNEMKRFAAKLEDGDDKPGLAIVDLNFLKKINDTHGHDKGNIAIRKLSRMVCAIFGHSPVFRIGGDEFAVILRGADYDYYSELEARFNAEMAALAKDDTLPPWEQVSAAIGAAFYDPELDDGVDSLFKRADHTMYDRKKEMKATRKD